MRGSCERQDTRPATRLCQSRLRGLLLDRRSVPRGFDLACAGRLQQAQAVARSLLRILIALSLVFDLQVGPLIRIHGLEVRSLELAIRCRLRGKQRRIRSPNSGAAYRYCSECRRARTAVRVGDALTSRWARSSSRGAELRAQPATEIEQKIAPTAKSFGASKNSRPQSAPPTIAMPMIPNQREPCWSTDQKWNSA